MRRVLTAIVGCCLAVLSESANASIVLSGQSAPQRLLGPSRFVQAGLYTNFFQFHRDASGKARGATASIPEADPVTYYARE